MSTTQDDLRYLWEAHFADGTIITQPANDQYSKHDPEAEWNPSAFRDLLEHEEISPLTQFHLIPVSRTLDQEVGLDLVYGLFFVNNQCISLEDAPLADRKLIYFRQMQAPLNNLELAQVGRYCIGYEGLNLAGQIEKKVVYING